MSLHPQSSKTDYSADGPATGGPEFDHENSGTPGLTSNLRVWCRYPIRVRPSTGRNHKIRDASESEVYRVPGERRQCPACAAPAQHLEPLTLQAPVRYLWRVGFISGCEQCGLLFANPLPAADDLARVYSPDGTWGRTRQEAPERPVARKRLERLFAPIAGELNVVQPPPGAAVFDFGCGRGEWLDALAAAGWATYGLEPATKVAFRSHRELVTVPATPQFSLIILRHVLEHVTGPMAVLEQIARATRPGGFLLISVPNIDDADQHLDFDYCLRSKTHVLAYTEACLEWLLSKAGFRVVAAVTDAGIRHRVVFARREPNVLPTPATPLQQGRAALARYYASMPGVRPGPHRLPVRWRAAAGNARLLLRGVSHRLTRR